MASRHARRRVRIPWTCPCGLPLAVSWWHADADKGLEWSMVPVLVPSHHFCPSLPSIWENYTRVSGGASAGQAGESHCWGRKIRGVGSKLPGEQTECTAGAHSTLAGCERHSGGGGGVRRQRGAFLLECGCKMVQGARPRQAGTQGRACAQSAGGGHGRAAARRGKCCQATAEAGAAAHGEGKASRERRGLLPQPRTDLNHRRPKGLQASGVCACATASAMCRCRTKKW